MGRNLSPIVRRELENLGKDLDSRKSAMKALKTYVKDLDTRAIPLFLAQVSETKEPGSSSGEYTISLYEVLARVHGRNIVPEIENIMSTIVRTLSSSAGSFPFHQACSKVVAAIARYGIDPTTTPENEKTRIVCSLCKPLSDVLMGSQESAASGAALCLKALVECDNWRFASNDMVNELCLKVAGALEETRTQTNSHMGLAMALSKHNALIIEAYARSLVRSGLQILTTGLKESNSQKRFSAVQMINFLMKCVDTRSISSELAKVIDAMEKCQSGQMPFVRAAALEALQTAKMITGQKGSRHGRSPSPIIASNFNRKNGRISSRVSSDDVNAKSGASPTEFPSPESQTVHSIADYDTYDDSSVSVGEASSNFDYATHANRGLWNHDSGSVKISLSDGLFREIDSGGNCSEAEIAHIRNGELGETHKEQSETFSGFVQSSATSMVKRETTPSPQRPRPQLRVDDVKKHSTPRKLIRSLQGSYTSHSGGLQKQHTGVLLNSASDEEELNPEMVLNGDGHREKLNSEIWRRSMESTRMLQETIQGAEPVSDCAESEDCTCKALCEVGRKDKDVPIVNMNTNRRRYSKAAFSLICCFLLLILAIFLSAFWTDNDEVFYVVPT